MNQKQGCINSAPRRKPARTSKSETANSPFRQEVHLQQVQVRKPSWCCFWLFRGFTDIVSSPTAKGEKRTQPATEEACTPPGNPHVEEYIVVGLGEFLRNSPTHLRTAPCHHINRLHHIPDRLHHIPDRRPRVSGFSDFATLAFWTDFLDLDQTRSSLYNITIPGIQGLPFRSEQDL